MLAVHLGLTVVTSAYGDVTCIPSLLAVDFALTFLCVCVMQCHHHHRQQRWGVVQTTGRHQVKAVHLPAAERQIHYQALVKTHLNTHTHTRTHIHTHTYIHTGKGHHLRCVSFCLLSVWYLSTSLPYVQSQTYTEGVKWGVCISNKNCVKTNINWPF